MEGCDAFLHWNMTILRHGMKHGGVTEGVLNWRSELEHLNSPDIYFTPIVQQILRALNAMIL